MRKLLLLAVLALLAAICRASPMPPHVEALAPKHPAVEVEGPEYHLSGVVRPVAYNLLLSPHFTGGTSLFGAKGFDGVVAIDMEVAQQTNRLELHRGATITHVHVRCAVVLHDPATPEPTPHPDTDPDTDSTPDPTPIHPKPGANRDLHPNPTSDSNHDTASAGAPHGRLYSERVEEMCAGGRPLEAELAGWDRVTEKLTFQLASALPTTARLRLVLSYEAAFPSGALTGFYVSNFTSAGANASVLATNFKPTHARKAFPCFDEPALKATFDLALQLTERFDAVANTPQVSRLANNLVIFATTPPMSTYLLAFLVFEQATFASEGGAGALVRTWARREAVQRGAAALSRDAGQSMLRLMEEYTQLPFADSGLAHAQQVALPDCRARAVESWGLAMAREDALLTKQDGSLITLMHVTFTVAREMVQQWFGNLVTTHWWDTTWLNEGFANYLQYGIIEREHPWWWISEQMVVEEQMSVLEADSAADVAALSAPGVHSPQDIDNQFGAIASSKGAAILRQINNVLGKQNFHWALQDYLNDRKFLDATPEHLFDALLKYNNEIRTGLNNEELLAVLRSWTETPGYPVLFVNRTGPDTFRLTQRRFLQNGADATEKYHVYVTWMTSREDAHWVPSDPPPAPMAWLGPEDTERVVTIPGLMADEWAIFNVGQGGYYRVHYDEATWAALEKEYWREDMVTWSMSRVDRAALHHNAVALARAGLLPWRRALCVVAKVRRDNQPVPWAATRLALAPLARLLHHRTHYKAFVNVLMKEAFDRWNYNFPTSELDVRDAKHKVMILDWACGVGYEPCLEETKQQLQEHFNGYSVHPDALVAARCHGLKGDDGSLWERLWAQYQAGDGALRSALTAALGCTDHAPSLRRYLEQSLDPGAVRGQDAPAVFLAVVANPEEVALQVALQFFEETGYDALEHAYRQVENSMNTIVDALASRMTETSQLEAALGKRAQQHGAALRAVQANAEWLRVHEEDALEAMAHCDAPAAAAPAAATALLLLLLSRLLALH